MKEETKTLYTLQAGRAIASIAVVLSHAHVLVLKEKYYGIDLFNFWPRIGALGVDFFFILSGFIMAFAHFNAKIGQEHAKSYAIKRFIRLYPIYWIVVLSFVGLRLIGIGDTPFSLAPWDIISWMTLVHFTPTYSPLSVAWTLFYEVQFYAIFGILIINRKVGIFAMILWLILILSNFSDPYSAKKTFLGDLLGWMNLNFFVGMLLCHFYKKRILGNGVTAGAIGLIASGIMAILWHYRYMEAYPWLRLAFAVSLGLAMYSIITLERDGRIHAGRISKFLGDASYSIYLVHLPILSMLIKMFVKFRIENFLGVVGVYIAISTIAVLLSCLVFLFVEKPVVDFVRKKIVGEQPSRLKGAKATA